MTQSECDGVHRTPGPSPPPPLPVPSPGAPPLRPRPPLRPERPRPQTPDGLKTRAGVGGERPTASCPTGGRAGGVGWELAHGLVLDGRCGRSGWPPTSNAGHPEAFGGAGNCATDPHRPAAGELRADGGPGAQPRPPGARGTARPAPTGPQ
ncbi:hypothetical protein FNV64_33420 [Streptomyces sp. S1A1-7]|nr:hypothetical protein FNV64_33420 [Streptomyces sp. S1A1-7]